MPELGYRIDLEDHAALAAGSQAFPTLRRYSTPDFIDHRGWLNVENQGNMGSCVGHGRSTCCEVLNFLDTGGGIVQLSRMFAYLTAQAESGLLGRDQGSTIDGAAKAAKKAGICLEKTFPYTGVYATKIPQAAKAEALEHKTLKYVTLQSYDKAFEWLASGLGVIIIGVRWVSSLSGSNGVVESLSGRGGGGHCVAIVGYTKRKDRKGRRYLDLVNSHGRGWGNNGWSEIAPAVIDEWIGDDYTEFIGLSDLEEFGPRRIPGGTFISITGGRR